MIEITMYLVIRVKAVSPIPDPEELLQEFQADTHYSLPSTDRVTVVVTEIIGGSIDPIDV